ncbi:MAG TPA: transposase [Terriglobia bacterium]|nr:transposase [Terriglobia bacterium]
MSILVLKLPEVKRKTERRPQECPYCGGGIFQRWGEVKKPVKDTQARKVRVYRYRCCQCRRTFRHYPEGTTKADQTERLRLYAVICWRLGLSYRGVSTILSGLKIGLCAMTVWRDAQGEAERLGKQNQWKPVRVLGVDGEYVLGWGEKRPVMVAVDLGEGQPVAVGYVNEHDQQAVRRWLEPIVQRLGVSVIVTDDLGLYRAVARQLNVEHQICQFHVRRWVGRALKELQKSLPQEWLWVVEEIKELITDLPPDGNRRLYVLWKRVAVRRGKGIDHLTPVDQLRDLLIRLSEAWEDYCAFYSDPDIPWTNNTTEQVIGRMKMRARTVRGYKTWPGMQTGLMLAGTKPN